jgi:hypothetical protein
LSAFWIGSRCTARASLMQTFRIKYKNNMYLATLWSLPYVCGNFFSRGINLSSESILEEIPRLNIL